MKVKNIGFTLTEVLIALGIASVVGTLLLVVIVNSAGLFYKQSSKVEQGLGVNDALAQVSGRVKEASSVAVSYQDGVITYTSGANQLVLRITSIDELGDLIADTSDHFVFLLNQDKLTLKLFPDAQSSRHAQNSILASNVTGVLFQYFDLQNPPQEIQPSTALKIKITLVLKQRSGADFEVSTATSEANLRNI